MKQCLQCRDMALYDDELDTCPLCNAPLVAYIRMKNQSRERATDSMNGPRVQGSDAPKGPRVVKPNQQYRSEDRQANDKTPRFEQRKGRQYIFRGTVTEINAQTRYYNRLHKVVNTVFCGEPYQFGNTSHASIIRVEEFHNGRLASQHRDLVVYGDIEGHLQIGDDVTAWTRNRGGRYVVQRLFSNETDFYITARPQMPAWGVALMAGLVVFLVVCLVAAVVSFIRGGGILYLFSAFVGLIIGIAMQFLPQLLMIGGALWILKMFLFGRK